jgi:hypothetical protein
LSGAAVVDPVDEVQRVIGFTAEQRGAPLCRFLAALNCLDMTL